MSVVVVVFAAALSQRSVMVDAAGEEVAPSVAGQLDLEQISKSEKS